MPSVIKNPNIQIKRFSICRKGNKHAEQPLNLVCLDPICRQEPLICTTCFSELHKYHKTMTLSELLSDYQGAIHRNHKNSTLKRIKKEHEIVTKNISKFKQSLIQKLDTYEQSVQQYFQHLYSSLNIREQLQKTLNISLEPQKIVQSRSETEIQKSLSFIINHSLFNQQNKIVNVSNILKCDQSRNLALLDKIVNQNLKYQTQIQKQFQKLSFVSQTIKNQSKRIQSFVTEFNLKTSFQQTHQTKLNVDPKEFIEKQTFYTTLNNLNPELKNQRQTFLSSKLNSYFSIEQRQKSSSKKQTPIFVFSNVYKHENLQILDEQKQSIIRSNVTASKPQYALICPSVDYQPQREQNWSIKINSCRNFASSKNTVAIGLCSLDGVINENYEQKASQSLTRKYLITSEGLMIKNGRQERCELTFTEGDVLYLKYDPYYGLLTIKKENGRKVSMKIKDLDSGGNEKLFACVRLTYASDQVQILNHARGIHN